MTAVNDDSSAARRTDPTDSDPVADDQPGDAAPGRSDVRRSSDGPTVLQRLGSLGALDWGCIALAFVGMFLLALSSSDGITGGPATLLRILGFAALLAALTTALMVVRERILVGGEQSDWETFEKALTRGVRMRVPDDMNYAATFPPALADLHRTDDPRFAGAGEARNAILGAHDGVHFCLFQHHHEDSVGRDAVDTVGLVSLPRDRDYDELPDMRLDVVNPDASSFEERFEVSGDERTADLLLDPSNRDAMMRAEPFGWQVVGNQLVTVKDGPSTPGETMDLIRERIELLAEIADGVPRDLAELATHD